MGKGTIISALGAGQYQLKYLYNRDTMQNRIDTLTQDIASVQANVSACETDKATLVSEKETLENTKTILSNDKTALEGYLATLNDTMSNLKSILASYQAQYDALKAEITSLETQKKALEYTLSVAQTDLSDLQTQLSTLTTELSALTSGTDAYAAKQAEIDAVNAQITTLQSQISEYEASISALTASIKSLQDEEKWVTDNLITPENTEITAQQKLIEAQQSLIDAKQKEIDAQQEKIDSKLNDISQKQGELDWYNLELTADQKRLMQYQNLPADAEVTAWCVDYSPSLTGEVATIEPYGIFDASRVLIRPGYNNRQVWDAYRDGQMQFTQGLSAAAAFYNLAMLPGWQRWMPTCRLGTITAIDHGAGTCTVEIDAETNVGADGRPPLQVSGDPVIQNVAIEYMDCNDAAFTEGDRVVVAYTRDTDLTRQNLPVSTPTVIGFESQPKECGELYLIAIDITPVGDNYTRKLQFYSEQGKLVKTVNLDAVLGALPTSYLYLADITPMGGGAAINGIVLRAYVVDWRGYSDLSGYYPIMVPLTVFDTETVRKDLVGMFLAGATPTGHHMSPGGLQINETLVYTGSSHWDMAMGYLMGGAPVGFVTQSNGSNYPTDWKHHQVSSFAPCVFGEYLYLVYSQGYYSSTSEANGFYRVHRDDVLGINRLWYADYIFPSLFSKMEFIFDYAAETGALHQVIPCGDYLYLFFQSSPSYVVVLDINGTLCARHNVHDWQVFNSISVVEYKGEKGEKGEKLFAVQMWEYVFDSSYEWGGYEKYSPMYLMRPPTFEIVTQWDINSMLPMICCNKPATNHMLSRINTLRASLPPNARGLVNHDVYYQPYYPLGYNSELSEIALSHLTWCVSQCRLSHEDANGNLVLSRTSPHGYWVAGETLAYVTANADASAEVDTVVNGWISSAHHYEVLVQFEHIQMGYAAVTLPDTCATLTLGPGLYTADGSYTTTDTVLDIPAAQRGKIRLYCAIFSGG